MERTLADSSPLQTTDQLRDLLSGPLSEASFVAVDTEFHRETTYWPQLCLIQLATDKGAWCIDPLSLEMDLTPFWRFLADPKICKVLHSARQDLEIFWHEAQVIPQNFYDTQIAVLALGYPDSMGYQSLVQTFLNKTLSKKNQVTDWTQRPLSSGQLDYALDDVRYLAELYPMLVHQIDALKRSEWTTEHMAELLSADLYTPTPLSSLRRLKPKSYTQADLELLAKLTWYREEMALEKNVPRKKIASDDFLLEWVSSPPETLQHLSRFRSVKRGQPHKDFVTGFFNNSPALSPLSTEQLPVEKKTLSRSQAAVLDALKFLLKIVCGNQKVSPLLVLSSGDLEDIARSKKLPSHLKEGWRWKLFGSAVSGFLTGETVIGFDRNRLKLMCREDLQT